MKVKAVIRLRFGGLANIIKLRLHRTKSVIHKPNHVLSDHCNKYLINFASRKVKQDVIRYFKYYTDVVYPWLHSSAHCDLLAS